MPDNEFTLPEELKGKTPEEMYKILNEAHVKELEAAKVVPPVVVEPPKPVYVPPAFVPPPPVVPAQQEPYDILSNPNAFMEQQFQQRIAPLATGVADAMRATNRDVFKSRIGAEAWSRFGERIDQVVGSLTPAVQMQLGAYDIAYNLVRGQEADKLIEEAATKGAEAAVQKAYETIGYQPQAPAPTQPTSLFQPLTGVQKPPAPATQPGHFVVNKPPKSKLSEEQARVAKAFNLSEDEYLEMAAYNTDWISQSTRSV